MINKLITQYLAPVIRHGLTAAGGWLVAQGLPGLNEATITNITDIVVGAAVFATGLGWSLIEKRFRKS